MESQVSPTALNALSYQIIAAAIEVHSSIGPGLLENVYRTCLTYELGELGMKVASEELVPIRYKHVVLAGSYRLDLLINDCIVVELKSTEQVLPVHQAQLLSYLRLTSKPLGLLINFNVPRLAQGVRRIVNRPGLALPRS